MKEIKKYIDKKLKDQKFDEGVKLYVEKGEDRDKMYDKKVRFFNNCKTPLQKQAAHGLLVNSLQLVLKKLVIENAPKKKAKGKAIKTADEVKIEEEAELQEAIDKEEAEKTKSNKK